MRISTLAERTGASIHALRHYEGLGLISASRSPAGYRDFADSVVREVTFIVMGRAIGFSLKEIAAWLPAYRSQRLTATEMIDALRERIARVDADIAALRAQRRRLVDHVGWFKRRGRAPRPPLASTGAAAPRPSSPTADKDRR